MTLVLDPDPAVAVAKVRAKAGIAQIDHDDAIEALIGEHLPALAYRVQRWALESADPGLIATLRLAAAEVVAGELLAQLQREVGGIGRVRVGDVALDLDSGASRSATDPSGLIAQGMTRLAPYLRSETSLRRGSAVRVAPIEPDVDTPVSDW